MDSNTDNNSNEAASREANAKNWAQYYNPTETSTLLYNCAQDKQLVSHALGSNFESIDQNGDSLINLSELESAAENPNYSRDTQACLKVASANHAKISSLTRSNDENDIKSSDAAQDRFNEQYGNDSSGQISRKDVSAIDEINAPDARERLVHGIADEQRKDAILLSVLSTMTMNIYPDATVRTLARAVKEIRGAGPEDLERALETRRKLMDNWIVPDR